jgi:Protein of unknown function (DUF3224)
MRDMKCASGVPTLLKSGSYSPSVNPSAVIAPNATLVGDVRIGARCVIGYGACLIAEGQPITLGEQVIVRDNAVIRSTAKYPVEVGNAVLIGPHTALFGCQSQARPRARAKTKITVRTSEVEPYDQTASPALVEVRLTETFSGDIEGESPVRALQVLRDDKSTCLVSMQRFRGRLGGRHGTFVLQGSEIVENGKVKATWSVVPGSGTGGLSGLRGEGGFEGEFGRGSDGTLDYWFE